jgi:acetyl-CoA C-acetyltransferase
MVSQARDAAIVGIYELPERKVDGLSPLQIKAECAAKALADAGLGWQDMDAIYDAQEGGGFAGVNIAEYFGVKPRVVDTTQVGGSSYEFHAAHARRDIASGRANVAVLTYGSTAASDARRTGTDGHSGAAGRPNPGANMERPWGATLVSMYAMAARRHMHEYGTTSEQLAEIATVARAHAMRNPQAVKAMEDLLFQNIRETTIADVVGSRMIADPLHLLDCCMISDGGGAVVIASPEVARGAPKTPVWIIGAAEAVAYQENGGDITTSAGAQAAPVAFGEAGIRPDEIDIAMVYDSFTITVMILLEDLGFCAKGEGGAWVQGGRLRWDSGMRPALNTDGGGLSSNHPGMRGIFLLLEAVRQLRGESTSQVEGAKLAVAHGNGGQLAGRHSSGTIVLARD